MSQIKVVVRSLLAGWRIEVEERLLQKMMLLWYRMVVDVS